VDSFLIMCHNFPANTFFSCVDKSGAGSHGPERLCESRRVAWKVLTTIVLLFPRILFIQQHAVCLMLKFSWTCFHRKAVLDFSEDVVRKADVCWLAYTVWRGALCFVSITA